MTTDLNTPTSSAGKLVFVAIATGTGVTTSPVVYALATNREAGMEGTLNSLDPDYLAYLKLEAESRGVPVLEVYQEELRAQHENQQSMPSLKHLKELAATPKRPAKYWDHGEDDCPF